MTAESRELPFKKVGVVGLGLLGRGITSCLLGHGFHVVGCERNAATREATRGHIANAIDELITRADFSPDLRTQWTQRYHEADDIAAVASCDFVIESIFEELGAKFDAYSRIEEVIAPGTPIASNTSAIPITIIQSRGKHPERFVGMHWAEPAHATRFIEIIKGEHTDEATFDVAGRLAFALGKEPSFVRKDIRGFITNRLCYAMFREALFLLESGVADAETIDRSFRNDVGWWATVFGPLRWMDMTGLKAYDAVMKDLNPELSNTKEVPKAMRDLMQSGAGGFANGRGFYNYTPEQIKHWEKVWYDLTWDVRKLAEKYAPVERPEQPEQDDRHA